ncbi:MAG TPA: TAXI family TRAP transporter solute-binding subunit [Solirubrobacter sp.]|nr:TAXI family TRAP transporter solute-binding subunit [Solirubrobacter sp.]
MDETLAHDLLALMFDNKKQLADVHPSAEKLTLEDAQEVVRPVELPSGAERYYQEAAE